MFRQIDKLESPAKTVENMYASIHTHTQFFFCLFVCCFFLSSSVVVKQCHISSNNERNYRSRDSSIGIVKEEYFVIILV